MFANVVFVAVCAMLPQCPEIFAWNYVVLQGKEASDAVSSHLNELNTKLSVIYVLIYPMIRLNASVVPYLPAKAVNVGTTDEIIT
jgi:hypothetical protein